MSPQVAELVAASKLLRVEDQLVLLEALREMIEDAGDDESLDITPELRAELDRRWEEYQRHPETAVNFEEAKARLAALRAAR